MSAIQECIVELESASAAQEIQGKSQEFPSVAQLASSESAGTSQRHVSKVLTRAKLPKLDRAQEIPRKSHPLVSFLGIFRV